MIDHALILLIAELTPTLFAGLCLGLGIVVGVAFDFAVEWHSRHGAAAQRRRETAFLRINAERKR